MRILSLLGVLLLATAARAEDVDLATADRAFRAGHYEESARLFHQLIEARGYSAPLLFDAANAELKAGLVGPALLDYERARYLAPGDSGINHNLQLARKQAGLPPDPYRWWQIVIRSIDWTVWLGVILVCLILIVVGMVGLAVAKESQLRHVFRAFLFICIPLALFFGFVELSTVGFGDRIEGVIRVKQATLRLSPFDSAERTGSIPEGELVTVEKRHDDYFWIDDRSRQSGWVSASELDPVVPGSFEPKK